MNDDLKSTDYNVNDVEEDPRFSRCRKEMLFTQIFCTILLISSIAVSYIFGSGDPQQYEYIAGYPEWYIYALGVLFIGTVSGVIFAGRIMQRPSLDAELDEEETDGF